MLASADKQFGVTSDAAAIVADTRSGIGEAFESARAGLRDWNVDVLSVAHDLMTS